MLAVAADTLSAHTDMCAMKKLQQERKVKLGTAGYLVALPVEAFLDSVLAKGTCGLAQHIYSLHRITVKLQNSIRCSSALDSTYSFKAFVQALKITLFH